MPFSCISSPSTCIVEINILLEGNYTTDKADLFCPSMSNIFVLHRKVSDAQVCVLRYVMSCYAMLCYVMLCYAMLCYAMLCYVMLCSNIL